VSARTLDIETRVTHDHHESLRVWLRLLACTNLIESRVRARLQAQFGTTLPRFDLMAQLERAPQGLKMNELSKRMMVTGGNVTGITDLLEDEGLVVRTDDPDDRRAYRVKLTKEGERLFRRMAAQHEQWVVGMLQGLSVKERTQLGALLKRLKTELSRAADEGDES
jgi:DNA-binding MarR family transcriptional regulator